MLKADHFAFQVSDLDAAISFYTETLGLELLSRELDEVHHEAFAFLELDGANLELLQLLDEDDCPPLSDSHQWGEDRLEGEIRQPYCPHLAIQVEDIDRLVATLKEKGVPIVEGPLEIPGKVRWLYVSDPDENVIEFVQWL
jgi:catechol 2,3-dioxygenase-like lactoylglutathione lyase family enzyme